jgi:hypothetical protein
VQLRHREVQAAVAAGDHQRAAVEPVEAPSRSAGRVHWASSAPRTSTAAADLVDVRAARALADHQQMAVVRGAHVG